jgi:hypothetical protein
MTFAMAKILSVFSFSVVNMIGHNNVNHPFPILQATTAHALPLALTSREKMSAG